MGTGQIVGGAGPGPGPGPGRGGAGVRVGTPVVGTPVGIGVPGLVPVPSGMRSGGGTIGGGVGGGDDDAGGRPSTTAGAHGGASRAARAHARHIPMAIGVNPVNPQHQNQNHPAAAMGPGVSGAGVSGVRFHQGGAASVRPRRASIALTEHGGADFFRSGRGLPGSVAPEVAATLEANVALVAEIRAVNRAEGGNSRAAAMKNAERLATLRDNLVRVSEAMRDAPGIMARMPQLPARLDLALADATLRPMGGVPEEGGGARSEGAGGAEGEGEGEGGAVPGGRGGGEGGAGGGEAGGEGAGGRNRNLSRRKFSRGFLGIYRGVYQYCWYACDDSTVRLLARSRFDASARRRGSCAVLDPSPTSVSAIPRRRAPRFRRFGETADRVVEREPRRVFSSRLTSTRACGTPLAVRLRPSAAPAAPTSVVSL